MGWHRRAATTEDIRWRAKLDNDRSAREIRWQQLNKVPPAITIKQEQPMDTSQEAPKPPSFAKLNGGDWGVRITGTGKTGDMVNVQRKDGKLSPTKLGQLVWEGNGVQLYAIDKGAPAEEVAF